MSRIGRAPVAIPAGVDVKENGGIITVKGPKGTLTRQIHSDMKIEIENQQITVIRPSDEKEHRSLHGLTRSLISNMVEGVTDGFSKKLEVNGVGFRVTKQGNQLVLHVGFSHDIIIEEQEGITYEVPTANTIIVSGTDKQKVGQMAAEIRGKRPPEPYLGKGIKYADEHIRRKSGKAGK